MRLKRTNDENNERERGMYAFWFYLGFSNFPENFLSTFGTFLSLDAVKEIRREKETREKKRKREIRERHFN